MYNTLKAYIHSIILNGSHSIKDIFFCQSSLLVIRFIYYLWLMTLIYAFLFILVSSFIAGWRSCDSHRSGWMCMFLTNRWMPSVSLVRGSSIFRSAMRSLLLISMIMMMISMLTDRRSIMSTVMIWPLFLGLPLFMMSSHYTVAPSWRVARLAWAHASSILVMSRSFFASFMCFPWVRATSAFASIVVSSTISWGRFMMNIGRWSMVGL